MEEVSSCQKKLEEDSCSQVKVNSCSQDKLDDYSCSQEIFEEDSCSQEKLEEDSCSQEKLEEHSSQSEAESEEDESSVNSFDVITENILGLVEEEFERDPACGGSSKILRENAEVIMAMLTEEQLIIAKIEKQAARACPRDTEEPPPKRRKC
ncbi:uncharacterized protein LOC122819066 [Drosophila biarmipes]|uniref:uncharacterized protein LOC122819066 n=1 Tax=Drosophila biarmipes TaxID=125945 RepID=UPI0021CCC6C3|nr:uncharacterized protein LOC122819066 [Drosophila biarmipes]